MRQRTVIVCAAVLVAVTITATATGSSAQRPNLRGMSFTVANFGGSSGSMELRAWQKPFERLTGVRIRNDLVDYAKLSVMVKSGNVTWDVAHVDAFFADQQCGKLFAPRNRAIVKSMTKVRAGVRTNRCGIPALAASVLLAYDSSKYRGNPPRSWADFFDTEKFPGKRSVWNFVLNGMAEAALLADGVPAAKLYPLNLSRAFRKMETVKDDTIFAGNLALQQQQVESGQVSMAMIFNGRLVAAIQSGAKWTPVWRQNLRTWDNMVAIKGSKNLVPAMHYLEYLLNPAVQNRATRYQPYTSMLKGPPPKTDPLTARFLPNRPSNYRQGINVDMRWWARNYARMLERWTQFTSG